MQSSLSELFVTEHAVIRGAGELISSTQNLWKSDPAAYEKRVQQLLVFFAVYADQFHHYKEEEILFPALTRKSETTGAAIVTELTAHHEEFRHLIQQIRASLSVQDFVSTQLLLESYIRELKDHIAVENDELFPMADDLFSADELDRLYYQCIDADREMGTGQKEELEELIKKLTGNETVQ